MDMFQKGLLIIHTQFDKYARKFNFNFLKSVYFITLKSIMYVTFGM
jgi:hypothetical protein